MDKERCDCLLLVPPNGVSTGNSLVTSKIIIYFLCWPEILYRPPHHSTLWAFLSFRGLLRFNSLAFSSCLLCCSHSLPLFLLPLPASQVILFSYGLITGSDFNHLCVDKFQTSPGASCFLRPLTCIPVPPVLSNLCPSPQASVSLGLTSPSSLLSQNPATFCCSWASETEVSDSCLLGAGSILRYGG